VLRAQGKLDDALKNYRDSSGISRRLAVSDPTNTDWQRGVAVSYRSVGDVLAAQGNLEDALNSYRDSLAVFQGLAVSDPTNTEWQNGLSQSYGATGEMLRAQGKLEGARKSYRDSLAIFQRLAASDRNDTKWHQDRIDAIGALAYELILVRDFTTALEASDLVISIAPNEIWLNTNRAHALMFLGHDEEAKALYLTYKGKPIAEGDNKLWERSIAHDFAEFRRAGLTTPMMADVEKELGISR
jgi:tetratricopeptide (TPR) repeat protein